MDAKTNPRELTPEETKLLNEMTPGGTANLTRRQQEQLLEFFREASYHPEVPTYQQEQFLRQRGLWDEWNCYSRKEVAQIIRNVLAEERSKRGRR